MSSFCLCISLSQNICLLSVCNKEPVYKHRSGSCTYNTTLCNCFVKALKLYKACCQVEVTRIFYCQSHISILSKQLEHEIISQICYGLDHKPNTLLKRMNQKTEKTNCPKEECKCCVMFCYHFILLHCFLQFFFLEQRIPIHLSSICGTDSLLYRHVTASFPLYKFSITEIVNLLESMNP